MKALKCDRCGKYYEKNVLVKSKGSVLGSVIGGIYTRTKEGKADEPFDLCDDCIKSLYEWKGKPEFEDRWIPSLKQWKNWAMKKSYIGCLYQNRQKVRKNNGIKSDY